MKKAVILSLVLALVLCFFGVTAFAGADANSELPQTWSGPAPVYPELEYGDEDVDAALEEIFGENSGILMTATICLMISFLLFVPSLVFMIVFIILNKFCNIFNATTKGRTNFIYSFSFYILICLESSYSFAINCASSAELIVKLSEG